MSDWEKEEVDVVERPEVEKEGESTDIVEETNIEEEEKKEEVEKREFLKVTLDNTPEDVLQYDSEGNALFFDDEPGRFLELPMKVFKELSPENRQRYSLARGDWEYKISEMELPILAELKIDGRFAKATDRIAVRGANPGMYQCWKRTDEVANCLRDGWRVAKGESLKTADSTPSGASKITAGGNDEMLLLEKSKEEHEKDLVKKREHNRRRTQGRDRELERDVTSIDPQAVYDPTRDQRTRFSLPVDSQGNPIQPAIRSQ